MAPNINPLIVAHLAETAGEIMNTEEEKHTAVFGYLAGLRSGLAGEPLRISGVVPPDLPEWCMTGIVREYHYYLFWYVVGWLSTKHYFQVGLGLLVGLAVAWYLYGG